MNNRPDKTSFVEYNIKLYSCVDDIEEFRNELIEYLRKRFNPDFEDDVVVEIGYHTPER